MSEVDAAPSRAVAVTRMEETRQMMEGSVTSVGVQPARPAYLSSFRNLTDAGP